MRVEKKENDLKIIIRDKDNKEKITSFPTTQTYVADNTPLQTLYIGNRQKNTYEYISQWNDIIDFVKIFKY